MKSWVKKIAFDNRLNSLYQYIEALTKDGIKGTNLKLVNEFLTDLERLNEIAREAKLEESVGEKEED